MKVIKPSVQLWTPLGGLTYEMGTKLLAYVERMGRISHRSEGLQTELSWKRFLETHVIQHGDWSITEHASFTALFRVDRGVTHELVRHRLFGFTQESTRFVNYEKKGGDLEFIYPAEAPEPYDPTWLAAMNAAESTYLNLLKRGWRPQEARSVLPNALAATIAVTGNLRNWRHAMLMRTSKETHPDFRAVTIPMLAELKRCIPILYDDIEPLARQIDNLRKAR